MTREDYIKLFHRANANLVAFKQVFHCDEELRKMVEIAIADEREACAKVCEDAISSIWEFHPEYVNQVGKNVCHNLAAAIRARGNT